MLSHKFFFGNLDTISVKKKGQIMKKNMAGLILVLFAIALFMTGCEKKAQEKEEAQEASARQLVIQKQTQTEIAEKKDRRKKTRAAPIRHRLKWK